MPKVAYVVGINEYHFGKLKGSVNDATEFAKLIEKNEDGSGNFAVKLITDITNRSTLKQNIIELFKKDDDTVLFYFSGHGMVSDEGVAYILTNDYEPYNEGLSMDEILGYANKSKARNKIIILDCCHSGNMGAPIALGGQSTLIAEGVTILTSSRDSQTSLEVNGHGVFTNLLVEALKGGAADIRGNITMGGIYAYIDRALGPWQQRPVFKTNVTRFVPVRNVHPPVPIQYLRNLKDYFKDPNSAHPLDPSYEWTNDPTIEHVVKEPYCIEKNRLIFKELQAMVKVGLIVPDTKPDMYWEAMEGGPEGKGGSCSLTPLGKHYWNLVNGGVID